MIIQIINQPTAPVSLSTRPTHVFILIFVLQSGERNGTPSRRSKSEGPPLANGRCVKLVDNVSEVKQIKEKVFLSSNHPSH
jgi:hypothetical protein